jgi:hypothetical protein
MKIALYFAVLALIFLVGTSTIHVVAQTNDSPPEDPNVQFFMEHLRNNWDDIHDVIMRFHYEDPGLKGTVFIRMNWRHGILSTASVDSSNTGNEAFGLAIIEALQKWNISELEENWEITLPIKTEIAGSNQPEFPESGILTGKVTDEKGNPVPGVKLSFSAINKLVEDPNPVFTNREGIFIKTLIPQGSWNLTFSKDSYSIVTKDNCIIKKGVHVKKDITLTKIINKN